MLKKSSDYDQSAFDPNFGQLASQSAGV